jgi:hypothetical protein
MHPRLLSGQWFLGWDALRDHWGNIVYTTHIFADWDLPLWAPHEQGGYFFLADPQAAPLYPINWLFALLTPVAGEGLWLILAHSLVHYAIAGTGMHYLLKEIGVGTPGRTLGGFAFVIAPRMAKAKDTSWHWSFAWTPWIFLAGYRLCKQPSLKNGVLFGVVTSVAFLAGYPPSWIRLLLLLAPIFLLWSAWELRRREQRARYLKRWTGALALAISVCTALAAPVALSTLMLFPLTDRAQMTLSDVLTSSLHPQQITTFVAAFGAGLAYPGVIVTMLAVFALRRQGLALRPAMRWLLGALTVVFFLLACGGSGPLLPLAVDLFPPLRSMRIPEHYLFVVVFLTSMLAGIGLDGLIRARTGRRSMPLLLCGALATVAIAAVCWVFYAPPSDDRSATASDVGAVRIRRRCRRALGSVARPATAQQTQTPRGVGVGRAPPAGHRLEPTVEEHLPNFHAST